MSFSILEFLKEHEIRFVQHGEHQHATEGWVNVDCSFCSKNSRHYRLGIPLSNPVFGVCWSCGSHPLAEAISETLDISIPKARKLLEGLECDYSYRTREKRSSLILPHGLCDMMPVHRNYLQKRGFDPDELASLWGVRAIGQEEKLAWRIFLPVHSYGEVVSWTTRSIMEYAPVRYMNARPEQERVSPKTLLFGEDYVRGDSIIVVEGPFDVYRIGPGAVATMGLSYSKEQILRMSRYKRRAVCFDNEPRAIKQAKRLCSQLEAFPGETNLLLLESGKDAGEASKKEINELRKWI